jgi:hypothetical protein
MNGRVGGEIAEHVGETDGVTAGAGALNLLVRPGDSGLVIAGPLGGVSKHVVAPPGDLPSL